MEERRKGDEEQSEHKEEVYGRREETRGRSKNEKVLCQKIQVNVEVKRER